MIKITEVSKEYRYPIIDCGKVDIQTLMEEAYSASIQKQGIAFDVFYDGTAVGQFMLTMITITDENLTWSRGENDFCSVKIEYIAVEESHQRHGIGTIVLKYAIKYIRDHIKGLPIRFIFLESVQDRVDWYKKYGFTDLADGVTIRNKDSYTVPLCIDLVDYEEIESYADSV